MKILIATGIFLPEIGGPATYVPNIAKEFLDLGHSVKVLTYSDKSHYPEDKNLPYEIVRIKRSYKVLNYWRYYQAIKKMSKGYDLIYAFDHFSAGIPAARFSQKTGMPLIIRVGGDFIWERYLDKTGESIGLRQFYESGLHLKKENGRFKVIDWVFKTAKAVVFTTNFQREIFQKYYDLSPDKLFIVPNPIHVPADIPEKRNITKEIIFSGRFINKNNIANLILAFRDIKDKSFSLVLIGEGPQKEAMEKLVKTWSIKNIDIEPKMSREELNKRVASAYLVVFPSYTDISPNSMLECISMNVPFISSTEIGFDWLADKIRFFEPDKPEQIIAHINQLLDPKVYKEYSQIVEDIYYNYSYAQAAVDTTKVFMISV